MKRCSKCKKTKLNSGFYKDKTKKDGLHYWCKKCCRDYAQNPKGKIATKKANTKYRQTEKGRITNRKRLASYRMRHPDRYKAVQKVTTATRSGKIPLAKTLKCYYCPNQAEQYHHHRGYTEEHALDVIPLCRSCHADCRRGC